MVIDHVFNDNYKDAEDGAKHLIRKFPENPAGYFCMAFVLDNWMAKYQTDKKEDEFYRFCDLAIEKGERILAENAKDEWAKFFIAGADGFKGTFEARYERWITAFRFGWKGVAVLLELEKNGCDIPDINFGIACYNYWRGALMKMLWWMPGIVDKRDESIKMLYEVSDKAIYTAPIATSALIDILLNEKRYQDALELAEKQKRRYPQYSSFLWGRARALIGLGRHEEAVAAVHGLIGKSSKYNPNNHYSQVVYHSHLAKLYFLQKKYSLALAECNRVKNFEVKGPIKKRLDSVYSNIKALRKKILKALKK